MKGYDNDLLLSLPYFLYDILYLNVQFQQKGRLIHTYKSRASPDGTIDVPPNGL